MKNSEIINNMYQLVGCEKRSYSPVEYAKKEGSHEPGALYPQYFFDAYPPFTKEKQYDIMMLFIDYVNFNAELHLNMYKLNFDNITVYGQELPEGLAQLVIETYPTLKYDLQQQIKEILCGMKS